MEFVYKFFIVTSLLINVRAESTNNNCNEVVQSNIKSPCSFLNHSTNNVTACTRNMEIITKEDECLSNSLCCWDADEPDTPCFLKPKKCYVDLRKETCYITTLSSSYAGTNGIFTGYSANGSYCNVPVLSHLRQSLKTKLGMVDGYGFPITRFPESSDLAPCRDYWDIEVTKLSSNSCNVLIYNQSNLIQTLLHPKNLTGALKFGVYCLYQHYKTFYRFDYTEKKGKQCVCRINAWIEADKEELPVSEVVRDQIEHLENLSTCSQILGILIRSSWLNVLSLTNREEANEMMDALVMLTKDPQQLTSSDIQIFLDGAGKVAQYNFYEGFEEDSAKDIIKKTACMASNVIASLTNKSYESFSQTAPSIGPASMSSPDTATDSTPDLKHNLFDVMDSMSARVASRVDETNMESEIMLNIEEEYVDLSLAISNSSTNMQRRHSSNFSKLKEDEVSVLHIPHINDTNDDGDDGGDDGGGDRVAVTSVFYNYPASPEDPNRRVSNYLTVNVWDLKSNGQIKKVSVPVKFTLTRSQLDYNDNERYTPVCAFINSSSSREVWSEVGCETTNSESATTCMCNHTTNFAILMKVTGSELDGGHNEALKITSTILGLISIVCLSGTIFVFLNYRKTLLHDRMIIHFHLVVALLFAYISMLPTSLIASFPNTTPSPSCIACAVLIHYFYLAVYFWSLVEGVYLFCKIVFVYSRKSAERVQKFGPLIGWLAPFVIVLISFTLSRTVLKDEASKEVYANPATCFLSVKSKMIWAFFGPVLLIIGINMVVLIKISIIVYKSSYSSNRLAAADKTEKVSESLKKSIRGSLLLMPILGVPTIIAVLYNLYDDQGSESVSDNLRRVFGAVGAYLQVILAGTQGVAIFFFYCFYNDEVRDAHKLATQRRKSMSSLEISGTRRKQSRLPLLFGRSETTYDTTSSSEQTKNRQKPPTPELSSASRRSPIYRRKDYEVTNPAFAKNLTVKDNHIFITPP